MLKTVNQALFDATGLLTRADIPDANRDARWLMAHALGIDASRLVLVMPGEITKQSLTAFNEMVAARAKHQPVSQITGKREFWGREFTITGDVLDPRPETELLIEMALESGPRQQVLDLGTGSGIIAITLAAEWPQAQVMAVDISDKALSVARENARKNAVQGRVAIKRSNWFDDVQGRFDLLVCNPPYISDVEMQQLSIDVLDWEPHIALTPGGDGLASYRHIASKMGRHLNTGAMALFEIGFAQGNAAVNLFVTAGFDNVHLLKDLNGHDRLVQVIMP